MFNDRKQEGPLTAGESRTLAACMTGIADPESIAGFALVVYACTGDDEWHEHTIITTTDVDDKDQLKDLFIAALARINRGER